MTEPATLDVLAEFWVEGWRDPREPKAAPANPQPKGSYQARNVPGVSYPIITADNPRELQGWTKCIRKAFRATGCPEAPHDAPLALVVTFLIRKPASVPKGREGEPATRPDIDKLERALMDALTYVRPVRATAKAPNGKAEELFAWRDDGQVVAISSRKRYCAPGEVPGAHVVIGRVLKGYSQPALLLF